jgi:unsaturated chondroitin disaccharide hydrolase
MLASRFVENAGFIQAWGPTGAAEWRGTSTIDTMMNLPLLWWAACETGADRYREIATIHGLKTRQHFFRPDGSTYHLLIYDPATGTVLRRGTFQGYSDGSCWSRGQAWAISGFAVAFRETGDPAFLVSAETAAGYFLRRLPDDLIPLWDFDDPGTDVPRDSSAGPIAAKGLLDLAVAHPTPTGRRYYWEQATRLVEALAECCQNAESEQREGILLHGCYSRPHGEGVDSALIWGDYYYLYSLLWLLMKKDPAGV